MAWWQVTQLLAHRVHQSREADLKEALRRTGPCEQKLLAFGRWLEKRGTTFVSDVTPDDIGRFMAYPEETGTGREVNPRTTEPCAVSSAGDE